MDNNAAMVNPAALALLKTSLGRTGQVPEAVEKVMAGKLEQAQARIRRYGLELDLTDMADLQFLVSVADYLYRKRDAGPGLPPMIRDEIHDRQVAKCTGGGA